MPELGKRSSPDPRILRALEHLHANPENRPSLAQMADLAGISPSRFRHLFVAATGMPFRRYRLLLAMGAAIRSALAGNSLTMAALDAGFSSSAHFSTAFRQRFGMAPTALIGALGKPIREQSRAAATAPASRRRDP